MLRNAISEIQVNTDGRGMPPQAASSLMDYTISIHRYMATDKCLLTEASDWNAPCNLGSGAVAGHVCKLHTAPANSLHNTIPSSEQQQLALFSWISYDKAYTSASGQCVRAITAECAAK